RRTLAVQVFLSDEEVQQIGRIPACGGAATQRAGQRNQHGCSDQSLREAHRWFLTRLVSAVSSWRPVEAAPASLRHANAGPVASQHRWRSNPTISAPPLYHWRGKPT